MSFAQAQTNHKNWTLIVAGLFAFFGKVSVARADASLCASLFAGTQSFEYPALKQQFEQKLSAQPPQKIKAVERLANSLFFIDFAHSAPYFADFVVEKKKITPYDHEPTFIEKNFPTFRRWFSREARKESDIAALYDRDLHVGAPRPAFRNYESAVEFLRSDASPLSIEKFRRMHALLMRNGVEAVPAEALGEMRTSDVFGMISWNGERLSDQQIAEISANPYLHYTENSPLFRGRSTIDYPTVANVKPEALSRIQATDADIVRRVVAFQETLKANLKGEPVSEDLALNRALIQALLRERFSWFVSEKGRLGDLGDPYRYRLFIRLAAQFYRDIVSIHPFINGNGRTCRLLLRAIFEEAGIAPPRLIDVDADLYDSFSSWVAQIDRGVKDTEAFYRDLLKRFDLNLDLENSPELIVPTFAREVSVAQKFQSGKKEIAEARLADLDSAQFHAFLAEVFRAEPKTYQAFKSAPVSALAWLSERFLTWAKQNRVDYLHEEQGNQEIGLHFITKDFLTGFNRSARFSPEAWQLKMNQWYLPQIVWRGLSHQDQVVGESEILKMFTELHPHMASNEVLRTDPRKTEAAVLRDFQRYNHDVFSNNVFAMAKDHTETGPMYATSYGLSTSKREEVAKAFAMGAMVIAPYGKQMEFQHLLKSRILVGAKRAMKDVDVGRLRQLNPEFKYKYGRQAEVMAIGAADPDSIMVIKQIGPNGETEITYARDPAQPHRVWKIRGDFNPALNQEPAAEQIISVIELR